MFSVGSAALAMASGRSTGFTSFRSKGLKKAQKGAKRRKRAQKGARKGCSSLPGAASAPEEAVRACFGAACAFEEAVRNHCRKAAFKRCAPKALPSHCAFEVAFEKAARACPVPPVRPKRLLETASVPPVRSRLLFEITIRKCWARLHCALSHCTLLCFAPCMDMHGVHTSILYIPIIRVRGGGV